MNHDMNGSKRPFSGPSDDGESHDSHESHEILCPVCQKKYTTKQYLHSHMRKFHAASLINCKKCNATFVTNADLKKHFCQMHKDIKMVECSECEKFFFSSQGLRNHMKKVHLSSEKQTLYHVTCCLCSHKCRDLAALENHIETAHMDLGLQIKKNKFSNMLEFEEWKEQIEKETCSYFVKRCGDKKLEDGTTYSYFYCHRNGTYVEKEDRKRRLKCLGTNKIGSISCPARISVHIKKLNNEELDISTLYQTKHIGHDLEIGRIPLQHSDKTVLAGKMMLGVPKEKILGEIRSSFSASKRICLTLQKDLHNISRDFKIDANVILHRDDALSVHMAVNKMKEEGDAVLVYKPCGERLPSYPHIAEEEFLLAIMNSAQLKLLELYGENGLLIDSTHGTNRYGFQLTTLMVNDSNHEGLPVAMMFSTKVRQETFVPFFDAIKERLPQLRPKFFMSDDAPAFYNAFRAVFGDITNHLLCAWHVRRAWNAKLLHVKNKEAQKMIKEELEQILHEIDICTFNVLTENCVKRWLSNADFKEFGQYFSSHYMHRVEQWAHCYRIHCGVNTNMKLERWHRQLKYEEGQGRVIKRLDKSLNLVTTAVGKKLIGRVISLERGKLTARISDIHKRHDRSMLLNPSDVLEIEPGKKWTVPSSKTSETSVLLEVYNINFERDCSCEIRCHDCKVCIHQYSCTCYDYSIHFTICKHIHLVCRQYFVHCDKVQTSSDDSNLSGNLVINDGNIFHHEEREAIEQQLNKIMYEENFEKVKLAVRAQMMSMLDKCSSLDQLKQIQNTLNTLDMKFSAESAAKCISLPNVSSQIAAQPSNTKVNKQRK